MDDDSPPPHQPARHSPWPPASRWCRVTLALMQGAAPRLLLLLPEARDNGRG